MCQSIQRWTQLKLSGSLSCWEVWNGWWGCWSAVQGWSALFFTWWTSASHELHLIIDWMRTEDAPYVVLPGSTLQRMSHRKSDLNMTWSQVCMNIALHVNLVFHVKPFLFYSMLVHVMLTRIGYKDISAKQRRNFRVGVVLNIPRSHFNKLNLQCWKAVLTAGCLRGTT